MIAKISNILILSYQKKLKVIKGYIQQVAYKKKKKKIEVLKLQMDLKIRMSEFFNNYQKVSILNYLRQNIVAELIVGIPKVYSLL